MGGNQKSWKGRWPDAVRCEFVSSDKFSAKGRPCGRRAVRYWWTPDGAVVGRCKGHLPGNWRQATEEERLVWEILKS